MKPTKRNDLPLGQRPGALPEVDLRGIGVHAISQVECVEYVLDELDAGRGGWVVTPNLDHLLRTTRLLRAQVDALLDQGKFGEALLLTAQLHLPVGAFFDKVMVNAEDPALRANRLGLLATLHAAMNRVADLSKLAA